VLALARAVGVGETEVGGRVPFRLGGEEEIGRGLRTEVGEDDEHAGPERELGPPAGTLGRIAHAAHHTHGHRNAERSATPSPFR
jgi:hypothetical protein